MQNWNDNRAMTVCFWKQYLLLLGFAAAWALQPVAAQTPASIHESERDLVAVPMVNDTEEEPRR
ncbi:MAG: hypothetical protein ACPHYG_04580, partial [Flavobacteriales bacterium]